MAHYPNMKKNVMKENCAFIGDRSITQYFDSLPRNIEINEIIFDGCVDLLGNIKMRKILRNPNTFYVVISFKQCVIYTTNFTILYVLGVNKRLY